MTLYEVLSLLLESMVVLILVIEFWYDWKLNNHVKSLKKRTKRNFDFAELNEGEGR